MHPALFLPVLLGFAPRKYNTTRFSFSAGEFYEQDIVPIGRFCRDGRPSVQLGPCSSVFIRCFSDGSYEFADCALGSVFVDGRCQSAMKLSVCFESDANALTAASELLAASTRICDSGPGVHLFENNRCSRQALMCDSVREPKAISCPSGQAIDVHTLRCVPSREKHCRLDSTPLESALIASYCTYRPHDYSYDNFQAVRNDRCRNWFVDCKRHSFVFCDKDQIFDKQLGCHRPQYGNSCPSADACRGWEWRAMPVAQCSPVFRFCEGLQPRLFNCAPGKVFDHDAICVSSVKPGRACHEYLECQASEDSRDPWVTKSCARGEHFDQNFNRCVLAREGACADRDQCTDGTSYNPTCGDYLLCRNGRFETGRCPHLTSWSRSELRCVEDFSCERYDDSNEQCRPGDVVPSSDCEEFQVCDRNGKYQRRSCSDADYKDSAACDGCRASRPYVRASALYRPLKCFPGEKVLDPTDCTRYVLCDHGDWVPYKCAHGTVFDAGTQTCTDKSRGRCLTDTHGSQYVPATALPPAFPPAPPSNIERPWQGPLACDANSPSPIPDAVDCGAYHVCEGNSYQVRFCPLGEAFNPHHRGCMPADECRWPCVEKQRVPLAQCGRVLVCDRGQWSAFHCKGDKKLVNGRCSQESCQTFLPGGVCEEHTVAPVPGDCTRYLVCRDGQFRERQCTNGQRFDADAKRCSYTTGCGSHDHPRCYQGERRGVPNECRVYEQCEAGRFVRMWCSEHEHWSDTSKRCESGACHGESPSSDTQQCTESPGAAGYRPDFQDCTHFFQCSQGQWTPKTCPVGTGWSQAITNCDHKINVPTCAQSS